MPLVGYPPTSCPPSETRHPVDQVRTRTPPPSTERDNGARPTPGAKLGPSPRASTRRDAMGGKASPSPDGCCRNHAFRQFHTCPTACWTNTWVGNQHVVAVCTVVTWRLPRRAMNALSFKSVRRTPVDSRWGRVRGHSRAGCRRCILAIANGAVAPASSGRRCSSGPY